MQSARAREEAQEVARRLQVVSAPYTASVMVGAPAIFPSLPLSLSSPLSLYFPLPRVPWLALRVVGFCSLLSPSLPLLASIPPALPEELSRAGMGRGRLGGLRQVSQHDKKVGQYEQWLQQGKQIGRGVV